MTRAKTGDTVRVNYTGNLGDGTRFDSSEGKEPLQFTLGEGRIIPGFESAVEGMQPGESKKIVIEADHAYGARRDELVLEIKRDELPDDLSPGVGDRLEMRGGDRTMTVSVTEVTDDSITVDANHPLAGQDLHFDIELVEIV